MKLMFKNNKFAIFDDMLPQDTFPKVWAHVQHEDYSIPNLSGNWIKVWRLGDNAPLGSREYFWSKKPFNNYIDLIGHYFIEIAKTVPDIVGDQGVNWSELILRTYLYPRNTKLSWHNDSGSYVGAFTYYIHPKWSSTWGGELMVAEVPNEIKTQPMAAPHLDHAWEDEFLLEKGVGQWIFPKPNRCVIMAGGTFHAINRVDADAGDNVRAVIVGFLIKADKHEIRVGEEETAELEIKSIG